MRISINYDQNGEVIDLPNNEYIKLLLRLKDVKQWQLADLMGVSVATMTRWMREELPPDRFYKMRRALNDDTVSDSWVIPGAHVKHVSQGEGVVEGVDREDDVVSIIFSEGQKKI